MNGKNCPNCGAPYDVSSDTCPYCKTSYFDMSAIDITSHEPFYLKLKVGGMIFTSKVTADPEVSIEVVQDDRQCVDSMGNIVSTIIVDSHCDIAMTLRSVPDGRGNLFTIKED